MDGAEGLGDGNELENGMQHLGRRPLDGWIVEPSPAGSFIWPCGPEHNLPINDFKVPREPIVRRFGFSVVKPVPRNVLGVLEFESFVGHLESKRFKNRKFFTVVEVKRQLGFIGDGSNKIVTIVERSPKPLSPKAEASSVHTADSACEGFRYRIWRIHSSIYLRAVRTSSS
jgi:hypothetical protein